MKSHLKIEFTLDERTGDQLSRMRDPEAFLQQLFRDALGEFCNERTPTGEYIQRRYCDQSYSFMVQKGQEVQERVDLAEGIKGADLRLIQLDEE